MDIEKKPIASTLREMHVGQVVSYPIRRMDVVRVTVDRFNAIYRGEMKWTTARAQTLFNVTRIQ